MKKVICLPVPKEQLKEPEEYLGYLFRGENGVYSIINDIEDLIKSIGWFGVIPQNLYIVNTEAEIKEGDWFIYFFGDSLEVVKCESLKEGNPNHKRNCKKIIATTNPELQLPLINPEFVEEYVNQQGKIDEVDVEFELHEVPKAFVVWKNKEETLEEAALNYLSQVMNMKVNLNLVNSIDYLQDNFNAFKAGVEWQKSRK